MNAITEGDFRTIFPDDLRYFARLTPAQAENYLALTTAYRKLLNEYASFLGVGKYDNALARNAPAVASVQQGDYDFYQRYSGAGLRYFYVRNNTYIERLSVGELGFLRERVREGNLALDFDSYHFVADTFARVIREQWTSTDGEGHTVWSDADAEINFGPNEDRFFCPNGALVIGCRVAERQPHGALEDVLDCIELLRQSLAARVSGPLSVVLFDAQSVRPLAQ